MSVHEVLLPSPPPDSHQRALMSGLFAKAAGNVLTSDAVSDPVEAASDYVARKKVDFHPFAQNILDLPQLSTPDSEVPPSLKSLPPSRDCQLSSRPILKQTQSWESTLALDGQNERKTTVDNMESLLQHLANNDRSSSVDAYQTITNLIKMYDEPPEQEVLQMKMAELEKYIRRDLVVLDVNADALPSEERLSMGNLVMSALKVLVTMVWSPTYSPCLTDDFRSWSIERSIQVLKEHIAPKATLLHYMHLLATQNFHVRIMAHGNRVPRILEAMQELTEHISGKAVVAERLLVYQKLVDQAKSTMKLKARLWVKNLLTAMGHSFKEVRSNAISAGTKACIAFAGQTSIALVAREALAEVNHERTLSSSMTNRLERVLAAKDEANQIPQIWTIILMLCNTGNYKLDTWPHLHEWLKLIQRCFNCSDSTVRVQAFMAWNRLYYVARPNEASEKVASMLAKPAMIQLDRTGNNQSGKGTRQAVVSSYCMLLYYAFRPSAQHAQYTRMWNEFVVKVMTRSFLSKSSANCDLSCRVLSALFHSSLPGSRVWNENRAHENAPLDPLELPAIDCKWVRSKMSSVLSIVSLLVDYSSFGPDGRFSEQAYVAQAWRNLVNSLRESTSKEVVPSADTKAAFTSILAFLRPALRNQDSEVTCSASDARLELLADILITELGPSTVLQALECPTEWRNCILLERLVHHLAKPSDEADGQQVDRAKLLDRCFPLLQKDMRHITQPGGFIEPEAKAEVLRQTNNILELVSPGKATQCLIEIQDGAATLMKSSKLPCQKEWTNLGLLIVDLLAQVSPTEYETLDDLLSAVLRTDDASVQEALLKGWQRIPVEGLQPSYGPRSLASIAALPERVVEDVSELVPGSRSVSVLFAALQLANRFCVRPADKPLSAETSTQNAVRTVTSRQQNIKSRPRHDDTQVQFVSIDSSPPDYENFESQLLTARQKDVRARQRAEPTLTFADIRSSPSAGKKQAHSPSLRRNKNKDPETPTTPVLPQPRAQDEDDQPPTPTPKARKSLLNHLQPDVPSSPASVVNGELVTGPATITSSPVKDPAEADDAIQFNGVNELDFVRDSRRLAAVDETEEATSVPDPKRSMSSRTSQSPELPGEALADYPEADASTPASYSDEYDALAASQLSQNLVEQSQESLLEAEIQEMPRSMSKRKRIEAQQGDSDKRKKRLISATAHHETEQKPPQQEAEEAESDTIIVNMDRIPLPLHSRRGRPLQRDASKDAASSSPTPSQTSQRFSVTTPSSRSSRGSRKSRTKRKPHSQASIEGSPVTQASIPGEMARAGSMNAIDSIASDVVMANVEDLSISELPSLASEVPETARDEAPNVPHKQEIRLPEAASTPVRSAAGEELASEIEHTATAPASALPAAPITLSTQSQGVDTEFGLAESLQSILEHLNDTDASAPSKKIDLANIHSLCFKIGLRAQELAMTQQ